MGDTMGGEARGRRHVGTAVRRVMAGAALSLFSRTHSGRYFGGFWFKVFFERGPC